MPWPNPSMAVSAKKVTTCGTAQGTGSEGGRPEPCHTHYLAELSQPASLRRRQHAEQTWGSPSSFFSAPAKPSSTSAATDASEAGALGTATAGAPSGTAASGALAAVAAAAAAAALRAARRLARALRRASAAMRSSFLLSMDTMREPVGSGGRNE